MSNIIACIDGSNYADHVCFYAAWAQKRLNKPLTLLHVVQPHSDLSAKINLSGEIGLGAKTALREELTKLDEERGKLELKRGQLMLSHANDVLLEQGIENIELRHRRGALVDMIAEIEDEIALSIMGKRGEHHQDAKHHLGSNLERVARATRKPLLVVPPVMRDIQKVLVAFDASPNAHKAVDFMINSALFQGVEAILLMVGESSAEKIAQLKEAGAKLNKADIKADTLRITESNIENAVHDTIAAENIDLLVMGSYGHSKIHNLLLGSTTSELIRDAAVPVMLF